MRGINFKIIRQKDTSRENVAALAIGGIILGIVLKLVHDRNKLQNKVDDLEKDTETMITSLNGSVEIVTNLYEKLSSDVEVIVDNESKITKLIGEITKDLKELKLESKKKKVNKNNGNVISIEQ